MYSARDKLHLLFITPLSSKIFEAAWNKRYRYAKTIHTRADECDYGLCQVKRAIPEFIG